MRLFLGRLFVFGMVWGLAAGAMAQSRDEMRILDLYFPKKDLVISATRHPKPISEAAENITIVTADEIRAMNAHTVADVLNRVPGLFINFSQGFGDTSLITIQGSDDRHVLVLLDGIRWNFLSSGNAETNTIPVGIIDRIEIIKGPASSAWGSALGGVVNIITRPAGNQPSPTGSVSVAGGESGTLDYRGQVAGQAGNLGYYLYAGHQESDGLWGGRDYDNSSFFSKFRMPLSEHAAMVLSLGYSEPDNHLGTFPSADIQSDSFAETLHVNAALKATITPWIDLNVSVYHLKQDVGLENDTLGLSVPGTAGDLFLDTLFNEKTYGGSANLAWRGTSHVGVFGFDFERGDLEQALHAGPIMQGFGVPDITRTESDVERWALFLNDTISFHNWSITPGIRFDNNSIVDSFFSPSLGITYNFADRTIIRATLARGFNYPFLSWIAGGGLFLDPNPDLDPEEVWSYQLGVETVKIPYLWVKLNLFFHDQEKSLERAPFADGEPNFNDLIINASGIDRRGIEIEAKTQSFYDISFCVSGAYVDLDPADEDGIGYLYTGTFAVEYNNPEIFYMQLFGRYAEWGLNSQFGSDDGDFIWELNVNKELILNKNFRNLLFFTIHNLFNGSQYFAFDRQNPSRWVEVGIRCAF